MWNVYGPGVTFPSLVWGLAAIPLAVWGVEEATGDWVLPSAAVPGLGFIIVLTIGAVEEGGLGTAKGDFCERGMGSWPGMKGGKGWCGVCVSMCICIAQQWISNTQSHNTQSYGYQTCNHVHPYTVMHKGLL